MDLWGVWSKEIFYIKSLQGIRVHVLEEISWSKDVGQLMCKEIVKYEEKHALEIPKILNISVIWY